MKTKISRRLGLLIEENEREKGKRWPFIRPWHPKYDGWPGDRIRREPEKFVDFCRRAKIPEDIVRRGLFSENIPSINSLVSIIKREKAKKIRDTAESRRELSNELIFKPENAKINAFILSKTGKNFREIQEFLDSRKVNGNVKRAVLEEIRKFRE